MKLKVGIVNVTGYAGSELARLLYSHPQVKLSSVTGRSAAGQKLATVFPHLVDIDLTVTSELDEVDIAFSAMPHKSSAESIIPLLKKGVKVIDISADFRLKNASDYPAWYDFTHPAPDLLREAVYGLPELHRSAISKSRLIANPGCYPTSALLALAPLIKEGIAQPDIIVDSKSGVSGSGRTLSLTTHFCEAIDSVSAYSLKGHRHLPEITQELEGLDRAFSPSVLFVPHLIPMTRGILSTCYVKLKEENTGNTKPDLLSIYREFYKKEPFVRIVDQPPGTKQTAGSNLCLIHPAFDKRTGTAVIISCLDNLVKGAAGQAIQNMNIMVGFSEKTGLEALPIYP
jgi:N-acetyl-gamma-glutamyl-phosphate reductase